MREIKLRVVRVIVETLRLDAKERASLDKDVGYKRIKKWTSARHAEIIVAIEDEFGIEIDERAIPKLNTLAKIVDYVQQARA